MSLQHVRLNGALPSLLTLVVTVGSSTGAAADHEPVGEQTFASPQVNPIAIAPNNKHVYVANTTSGTVDVIETASNTVIATVSVGMDPVSVAVRPDSREVWVANHVSDSVSIIDTNPSSLTLHEVIDTVQSMDGDLITTFDEPAGIAFASNDKAYVALSSRNEIAVIDVDDRRVIGRLEITAQDPRAIAVAGGLLYVAAFESMNQTELSSCPLYQIPFIGSSGNPPDCTLGILQLFRFITDPNLPRVDKNIVIDVRTPDRDLFVFDTEDDSLVDIVDGVGTLLYGVAADPTGRAYVTNTDARNAINGAEGGLLADLGNRMFDNRITTVDCSTSGCGAPVIASVDGATSNPTDALATPYGIAVSKDRSTLVVTAAAASRLFTVNAASGAVLGALDLGAGQEAGRQIPRGIALRSRTDGAPRFAYVLNTLENSVAVVNVRRPDRPRLITKIAVGADPTDDTIRRGRIEFNNAFASDSGSFACASCHPDGNTDQILWRIGGACEFGECSGNDEPRLTMPIRGLRNTVPLHWDGILGDPIGGPNGAVGLDGTAPPTCA
ncbi:MAG: beta-propeller fold lactonase family protein, partial [Polyangiales bacterium]